MPEKFSLQNFEGPLDLLFLLIQRDEVQIIEIALHLLTKQLLGDFQKTEISLDRQADQTALLAQLLALKSRKLMPYEEVEQPFLFEKEERYTLFMRGVMG